MIINTPDFIESLAKELKRPLPGKDIQYLMAPTGRDERIYRFPVNETLRQSSVMILLFIEEKRWKFPLILWPEYPGVHSGQMALPGGRGEPFDQDLIETAIRETHEEIGVDRSGIGIIGKLTELEVRASHNNVLPVIGYYHGVPEFRPDPAEVDSVHVVLLDEIIDDSTVKNTTLTLNDKYKIETPYYDIHGKIVWGATAMILSEFLYIVRKILNH